jgi:phosphotransacetylase
MAPKMANEGSAFQIAFNKAREYFNEGSDHGTTSDIIDVNTKGLNVKILALVCLMLIHNAETGESDLNINTLKKYNLNKFEDQDAFKPYIMYLLSTKKGRGKNIKKVEKSVTYAYYVATFINYLFIAKDRDVAVSGPSSY